MTISQIIDQIVIELTADGRYRRRAKLFSGDVDFDFQAVLTGPRDAEGLVTVHDVSRDRIASARCAIRALTTFLSRSDSRRPLILVAVTQAESKEDKLAVRAFMDEVSFLCRVIEVPFSDASPVARSAEIRNRLTPLLPIQLPKPIELRKSPEQRLRDKIGESELSGDELVRKLIEASAKKSVDVEATMIQAIAGIAHEAGEVTHD
jgi:hypothetical protein